MQRDIFFYKNKAKENLAIRSDRQLSEKLGLSSNAFSQFCTYRAFPSDETMHKLAELAGEDPMQALIDLNMWRAPESVKSTYANILQKLAHTTAAICILAASSAAYTPAQAASILSNQSAAECILW